MLVSLSNRRLPVRLKRRVFMRATSLGHGFGARVDGIALHEIGDRVLSDVISLLEEWGLLVFPRQALDDRDLHAFATRIGSLEESSRKVCLSPQFPAIGNLSNLRDDDGERIGFASTTTDFWHSDQQHRENPATLAFLYCLVPSPAGGATSFVSTDVDRTGLDSDLIDRLAALRVVYEPAPDHDNIPATQVSQPALLKSPTSQRRFAYVSENTVGFLGLGEEGSATLKRLVLDHLLHPSRVYSHDWTMGDLILYDNAQLMHRREPYEGRRWLKTAKIFAPKDTFAVPA
ncbi:TauD/TfdA dioxygenase family protein [Mycobacterium riyadhense]|uniref:TauD/TfdA dioxygenase family protein n=1 Tax=Mycobacterium riyadhense TaxID=486698 RepID=UPI000A15FBCE|nr:TauD/TfdA family dioxygenase [Mycobacterium riyadhense]MCV7147265.1 TauD/TfdA family dioxygenase [Mycobacterium riyadhense]